MGGGLRVTTARKAVWLLGWFLLPPQALLLKPAPQACSWLLVFCPEGDTSLPLAHKLPDPERPKLTA